MNKILFGYVVVIAICTAGLEVLATPPSEEPIVAECTSLTDQLANWQQKLYQDSCMFEMAFNDSAKDGSGIPLLGKAYDNYIFGLLKNVEYDRIKILELKRK